MSNPALGPETGVTISVKNTHASTTLQKGRVVSLNPAATLDQVGEGFLVPVTVFDGNNPVGIVKNPIAAGDTGTVVIMGAAIVETNGSVAQGNFLEIDGVTVLGRLLPRSSGKGYGLALNTDFAESTLVDQDYGTGTTTYALAMVNFAAGDPGTTANLPYD